MSENERTSPEQEEISEDEVLTNLWKLHSEQGKSAKHLTQALKYLDKKDNHSAKFRVKLAHQVFVVAASLLKRQIYSATTPLALKALGKAFENLPLQADQEKAVKIMQADEELFAAGISAEAEIARNVIHLLDFLLNLPSDMLGELAALSLALHKFLTNEQPESRANLILQIEEAEQIKQAKTAFEKYLELFGSKDPGEAATVAARYLSKCLELNQLQEISLGLAAFEAVQPGKKIKVIKKVGRRIAAQIQTKINEYRLDSKTWPYQKPEDLENLAELIDLLASIRYLGEYDLMQEDRLM